MARFFSDVPINVTGAIGVLAWLFTLIGLGISQATFDQSGIHPTRNPYSLAWFFVVFYLVVHIAVMVSNSKRILYEVRYTLLALVAIAFVFVVFQLDSALNSLALFKDSNNTFMTGAALSVTGLLILSVLFLYWLLYLGSVDWFDAMGETRSTGPQVVV